jgi:hypothetical protein
MSARLGVAVATVVACRELVEDNMLYETGALAASAVVELYRFLQELEEELVEEGQAA